MDQPPVLTELISILKLQSDSLSQTSINELSTAIWLSEPNQYPISNASQLAAIWPSGPNQHL